MSYTSEERLCDVRFTKAIIRRPESGWGVSMYTSRSYAGFPRAVQESSVKGKVCYFMATGICLPQETAMNIDLIGRWKKTGYGDQFAVTSYEVKPPSTIEEILQFLQCGGIRGIGRRTAQRIVDAFGEDTLKIMSETPEKLLSVRGVREDMLENIRTSVGLKIGYRNLQALLGRAGFSGNKINEVYRMLGDNAADEIRKSPYVLMNVRGIGFSMADKVAMSLGVRPSSRQRLIAALRFAARQESQKTGNVFLHKADLVMKTMELVNDRAAAPVTWERLKSVLEHALPSELLIRFPDVLDAVFLPEYDQAEFTIAQAVAGMVKQKKEDKKWLQEVNRWLETHPDIQLTNGQKEAVEAACQNRIIVITGGAGTGKTTIAKTLMKTYRKAHPNRHITLLAPTGKAARRLSEATGEYASTIHSALKMQTGSGPLFYRNALPEGLVVVDESSMVDLFVMQALMSAIVPGTTLVLLGDVNQLPSVGPGAVLAEIIRSGKVEVICLTEIMRQGKESLIIGNSLKVNEGDRNLQYGDDFCLLPADKQNAQKMVIQTYLREVSEFGMNDVAVLTPLRKWGDLSCIQLNRAIQERGITPGGNMETCHGTLFSTGDRVIQTRNTESASNGDIGYITSITSEYDEEEGKPETVFRILFESGSTVRYTRKDMEDIDLAYALTIHKSQGSEYKSVIIPMLMDYKCPLYKRNLLYTAITRARQKVTIIGHEKAIALCINTPDIGVKNTLLANRIYLMLDEN